MKCVSSFLRNKAFYQYTASLSIMLMAICSGLHFGWTSPYLPILLNDDSPVPMTKEQSSWVATVYLVAGPCGALAVALTLNVFGRKPILICSSVFFVVSWLMLAFVGSLTELLLVRFLAGMADGLIFVSTPVYLAEILEKKIRGFFCSLLSILYIFGVLLINVLGTCLSIKNSSLVIATLPIAFLLIFVWMPESPIYLLMKGEREKARECLEKLRSSTELNEEFEEITKSVQEDAGVTLLQLFSSKVHLRSLLVVMGLRGGQQLSGVTGIIFYAQTVFREAGDVVSPLMSVVVLYSVEMTFSIVSSFLVDKIGRRPLLITSTSLTALALLVEGTFFYLNRARFIDAKLFEWLAIGSMLLFVVSYSVGLQIIPLFIVGEIFPTNLRCHASAISDVCYFVFAFVASKIFQVTKDTYGLHVSFFTFSACTVITLNIVIYFAPETKNKTLHEIQLELNMLNA